MLLSNILILIIFSLTFVNFINKSDAFNNKKIFFSHKINDDVLAKLIEFAKHLKVNVDKFKSEVFIDIQNHFIKVLNKNYEINKLIRLSHRDGNTIRLYIETQNDLSKEMLKDLLERHYRETLFLASANNKFMRDLSLRVRDHTYYVKKRIYSLEKNKDINNQKLNYLSSLNRDGSINYELLNYEKYHYEYELNKANEYLKSLDDFAELQSENLNGDRNGLEEFLNKIQFNYIFPEFEQEPQLTSYIITYLSLLNLMDNLNNDNIINNFTYDYHVTDYTKFKKFFPIIFVLTYLIIFLLYYNFFNIYLLYKKKNK